ncbi:hypothetical protein A4G20_05940 [Pasteurellaceae bacterium RH1A]|nr:hypothetical protein A4G20_05940 [Pasteurellaceae bacterium RH1A]
MFKSSLVLFSAAALAACSGSQPTFQTISDKQMQAYIVAANQAEQCLYPQIQQMNNQVHAFYESLPINETAFLHTYSDELLKQEIGETAFDNIQRNTQAREYFEKQFTRLNHSKPTKLNPQFCAETRLKQREFLGQYGRVI